MKNTPRNRMLAYMSVALCHAGLMTGLVVKMYREQKEAKLRYEPAIECRMDQLKSAWDPQIVKNALFYCPDFNAEETSLILDTLTATNLVHLIYDINLFDPMHLEDTRIPQRYRKYNRIIDKATELLAAKGSNEDLKHVVYLKSLAKCKSCFEAASEKAMDELIRRNALVELTEIESSMPSFREKAAKTMHELKQR